MHFHAMNPQSNQLVPDKQLHADWDRGGRVMTWLAFGANRRCKAAVGNQQDEASCNSLWGGFYLRCRVATSKYMGLSSSMHSQVCADWVTRAHTDALTIVYVLTAE